MAISNGMLDPGNVIVSAPYFISGKSGTLTGLAAGNPVATLVNFGRLSLLDGPGAPLIPAPLRISQIRMKYIPITTPAASGVAFEVYKGTSTVQRTTGGTSYTPTPRKTTGYQPITAAEVSLYVGTTGAVSGGNFTVSQAGSPLDMMALGGGTNLGGAESIWTPSDLCPLSLEAGEGAEVQVTNFTGTGILLVAFDFLRQ